MTPGPNAMSADEHRLRAPSSVACAVVTISDTRTEADDHSGKLAAERLTAAGHVVARRCIIKDEPAQIRTLLSNLADEGQVQAVLLNGGTGISRRDSTFEAVDALLEKRLTGFGELFRQLSYAEIGAAAMLSRACAGVYRDLVVFSMPGSPAAVRLALDMLILPELGHVVGEMGRHRGEVLRDRECRHQHAPAADPPRPSPAGLPQHPQLIRPEQFACFQPDKMGKSTLFQSERILVGLNCFEPGQEHKLHAHAGMDKVYHVLEGRGKFLVEGEELPLEPGWMLIAPQGAAHGIRNCGDERLIVLTILAPAPG